MEDIYAGLKGEERAQIGRGALSLVDLAYLGIQLEIEWQVQKNTETCFQNHGFRNRIFPVALKAGF